MEYYIPSLCGHTITEHRWCMYALFMYLLVCVHVSNMRVTFFSISWHFAIQESKKNKTHWWFLFNFFDGKAPLNAVMLSSCLVGHFLQTGWLFLTLLVCFDYWQFFFWIETRWKHRRDMSEKTDDETYCGTQVPSTKPAVLQTALPWSLPMRDERCGCLWQPENWRDSRRRGMDIYNVMGKHTHACSHRHMHTQSRAEQTIQWNNTQWVSACMIH